MAVPWDAAWATVEVRPAGSSRSRDPVRPCARKAGGGGTSEFEGSFYLKSMQKLYFHTLDLVLGRKSHSSKRVSQTWQTSNYNLKLSATVDICCSCLRSASYSKLPLKVPFGLCATMALQQTSPHTLSKHFPSTPRTLLLLSLFSFPIAIK